MLRVTSQEMRYLLRNWLDVLIVVSAGFNLFGWESEWVALAWLTRVAMVGLPCRPQFPAHWCIGWRLPGRTGAYASAIRPGTLTVGAEAREEGDQWIVGKVVMSRSARRLMEGWVRVPRT